MNTECMCVNKEMKLEDIVYGDIVMSVMGRDTGTAYLVVGVTDKSDVLVADGKLHRLEAPKRKNVKHLVKIETGDDLRQSAEAAAEAEFGADKRLKKLMREAEMLVQIRIRENSHGNWRD
ncbi:MAG: hypothetical protein E7665_00905 [Ruminococcaceae bacterium]|nr:hypothetical protein [Oscillospiraceae bacterium]